MKRQWEALRKEAEAAGYSRTLGMRVLALGSGYSKVAMTFDPTWTDYLGEPHRGVLISLADQAFGTATNTLDPRFYYVAVQFGITFMAAPRLGEELTAEGRITSFGEGRGTTDMVVHGADGRLLAKASGAVLAIPR
jgi:acyl-CoA thioesterase